MAHQQGIDSSKNKCLYLLDYKIRGIVTREMGAKHILYKLIQT